MRLSVNERTQTKAALRFRWALFKPTLDDQHLSWAERQRPPHAGLLGTLKTFLLENKKDSTVWFSLLLMSVFLGEGSS